MSYQVTRIFDTAEEAIAFLEATNDNAKPAPKKKPAAVVEDDEPAPKPKKKPAPKDDGELDYETDVRPHVVALSKDHGRDVALEVLEQFTNEATDEPCTKGQEVSEADWPKLLAKIKNVRKKLDE